MAALITVTRTLTLSPSDRCSRAECDRKCVKCLLYATVQVCLLGWAAMSVIRMVKLFGWEPRVADQLAEKREDELTFIRKYKILELINNNIKYVLDAVITAVFG